MACLYPVLYRCCTDNKLQRTVAVEIKTLVTEGGRFAVLHQLRCAAHVYLTVSALDLEP